MAIGIRELISFQTPIYLYTLIPSLGTFHHLFYFILFYCYYFWGVTNGELHCTNEELHNASIDDLPPMNSKFAYKSAFGSQGVMPNDVATRLITLQFTTLSSVCDKFQLLTQIMEKKNGALKLHLDAKLGITTTTTTMGVSHYGLAIYIKMYLKAKEELWKLKYLFHHANYT